MPRPVMTSLYGHANRFGARVLAFDHGAPCPDVLILRRMFVENRIVNPAIIELDPSMVDQIVVVFNLADATVDEGQPFRARLMKHDSERKLVTASLPLAIVCMLGSSKLWGP
jgi:hypothetical protein